MKARRARSLATGVLSGVLCALVLTACSSAGSGGGAGPSGAPAGSASTGPGASGASTSVTTTYTIPVAIPATTAVPGDEVAGRSRSFTVVPPEGWAEATDRAQGVSGLELVLLSSRKVDGFANNLVVLGLPGDEEELRAELDRGRTQMEAAGRTVSDAPGRTVGGVPASGFTTVLEQQGITVVSRTWAVAHAGRVYLLTLSASQQDADHALTELDEILSSWTWT